MKYRLLTLFLLFGTYKATRAFNYHETIQEASAYSIPITVTTILALTKINFKFFYRPENLQEKIVSKCKILSELLAMAQFPSLLFEEKIVKKFPNFAPQLFAISSLLIGIGQLFFLLDHTDKARKKVETTDYYHNKKNYYLMHIALSTTFTCSLLLFSLELYTKNDIYSIPLLISSIGSLLLRLRIGCWNHEA